jgi:aromatic ring-opening dioxygenase LigB subunit
LSHHVDPDLIFLSSPHGITLSNDFGIYLGSTASGSADIGKDLHNASHAPYRVHLPTIALDPRFSQQLVNDLVALQQNVSAIQVSADDSVDIPLQWAEVIPLMLIPPRQKQSRIPSSPSSPLRQRRLDAVPTSIQQPRRHLILSQPLRRYTHATDMDMVSELVALGRMFRTWIDARPERVAVVISGDMSHTHRSNGPYGYSDQSSAFDAAVGRWASDPCHQAASLLEEARFLQPKALSCGFTGMVLLHGMLCSGDDNGMDDKNESDNEDNGFFDPTTWDAHVWVNRNVTYYGMMVASYERVAN